MTGLFPAAWFHAARPALVRVGGTALILATVAALAAPQAVAASGRLTLEVVDAGTKKPTAARMHLKRADGKVVKPPRTAFWKDHFPIDGALTLELRRGQYQFELERGPEYKVCRGHFEIRDFAEDTKVLELHRFVDMAKHGWWSGDLHVHRRAEEMESLMRADDLHVAPVITWWNAHGRNRCAKPPDVPLRRFDGDRYYTGLAGEDERRGGALMYFHLARPIDMAGATSDYPSSMAVLRQARGQAATATPAPLHVDAEKPFWWDVPVWLASGMVDSIGLANNHMWREGMLDNEAWGRPRDTLHFPSPLGNGRWSETIYYHVLNCGLRIPPSAGSASGVLPNPIGYNRVYVHCGNELAYATWWENLRAGKVFVSNGPLLMPRVNGELPGHVFRGDAGMTVDLNIALKLWTRDRIEYVQVIKNGAVCHEARLDDWARAEGKLPPVHFDQSGWLLVRAITNHPQTYRFASTGPYYVEIGSAKRISRHSSRFFVDWIDESVKEIEKKEFAGRDEVVAELHTAQKFWQDLASRANTD